MKLLNKRTKQKLVVIALTIIIGIVAPELITTNVNTNTNLSSSASNETGDNANLDSVKFIRTVDGDTIIVEDSNGEQKRVRMIGIDTPESVAKEAERNNEYGVMASDYTKQLLSNTDTLYLEYDVDDDDQYDRILAYVWLKDVDDTFNEENIKNSMVNAIIVENGYGIAKRYEPTVAHDSVFQKLMNVAESNDIGLWRYEGFRDLWNN